MQYQSLWNKTLVELSKNYTEEIYQDIFSEVKTVIKYQNGIIFVLVPNLFIKKRILDSYNQRIQEILKSLTMEPYRFKFVVAEEMVEQAHIQMPEVKPGGFETNLNLNHTFDSFVVGDSNKLSYHMALKIAEQPGVVANPLYIFGSVGLGKTHLMHAIGNFMYDMGTDKRVLYVQANTFIGDYSKAATSGDFTTYNQKYNNLDALLIDDIQMLADGKKSQQQFFQIFNELKDDNKQIVITSDCKADELKGIMDRLTSRFADGIAVDIRQPDLSHRVNILKRKVLEHTESNVPDEVLEYIASQFTNNIRELQGAFNRVLYHSVCFDTDLTVENAKEALSTLLKSKSSEDSSNSHENLKSVIANYYNITVIDLLSAKRSYKYVLPRHIAMHILKSKYNLPYKRIGMLLGGKDHATVISACAKIEQQIQTDIELKNAIDTILKKIE